MLPKNIYVLFFHIPLFFWPKFFCTGLESLDHNLLRDSHVSQLTCTVQFGIFHTLMEYFTQVFIGTYPAILPTE